MKGAGRYHTRCDCCGAWLTHEQIGNEALAQQLRPEMYDADAAEVWCSSCSARGLSGDVCGDVDIHNTREQGG